MTHFYPLWERLTPGRLRTIDIFLWGAVAVWVGVGMAELASQHNWVGFWLIAAIIGLYLGVMWLAAWQREPRPVTQQKSTSTPNILLIGADTLRADRLNGMGYPRELTPTLEALARRATRFTDCYVPCARTAPSLASILTGTWPHTHGVRDTFVTPEETRIPVAALPEILRRQGYKTAAVGDWAVSDVDKFDFGFEQTDMPHDQWNIKYLLRQGPKDIRLFLSLFTQNAFGKRFLPEIYYLGGHPLTEEVGRDTRRMIAHLAQEDAPFFLMSFMATTHPPFTSKYPYYATYADKSYRGESKFAMARLRDPFEIIRRQGEPKTEFDLDQIINLYDGCVRNFDDELKRILDYLEDSGLKDNTIVVIFSDHGMEFFEHETWGQGNSAIGDFSARVPLIIADPRNPKPCTISDVVRTVDLAPTLLELINSERPGFMEGVSLASLMRNEAPTDPLPAFYETGVWLTDLPGTPDGHLRYPNLPELLEVPDKQLGMISLKPNYGDIIIAAKDRMVRLGDWKLTYQPLTDGALYQLFNIREDAACCHNVIEENPQIAERLKTLLEQWMSEDNYQKKYFGDNNDDHQSQSAP
jgi:arylsulfatase A-like enzyme